MNVFNKKEKHGNRSTRGRGSNSAGKIEKIESVVKRRTSSIMMSAGKVLTSTAMATTCGSSGKG